jgi:hypothetical protein
MLAWTAKQSCRHQIQHVNDTACDVVTLCNAAKQMWQKAAAPHCCTAGAGLPYNAYFLQPKLFHRSSSSTHKTTCVSNMLQRTLKQLHCSV